MPNPARRVDARHGIEWIVGAARLMLANPAPFLAMGLALTVIGAIPLLGTLALVAFGPALNGGIMLAAQEHAEGRQARFEHLLQAFRQPGKLPMMLALCLPAIAAGLLFAFLAVIFFGGTLAALGSAAAGEPPAIAELGAGLLAMLALGMMLGLVAYALVFFATPRVMLDDLAPLPAMRESLDACLANVGALALYLLCLMGLALAVLILFAGWLPLLAQLALGVVVTPLVAIANYLAARQILGGASAAPPVIEA